VNVESASVGEAAISAPCQINYSGATTFELRELQVGARLVIRCRKDWRDATVVATSTDSITLSVGAPSGRTYRLRRPADAVVSLDGFVPVLGTGAWKYGLVRYDCRW
jgi:hypothetical protein